MNISLSTKCKILVAAVFIAGLFSSLSAHAEYRPDITDREKAVFAFFKVTRGTPFFDSWIRTSDTYLSAPKSHQEEVYEAEAMRLKWGFGTYDEKTDFLKISTRVFLQLQTGADGASLNFKFPGSESEEIPIFPYPYGADWITLAIDDLYNFTSVPLGPKQYELVASQLEPGKIYKGSLKMRIRPLTGDAATPLLVDGVNNWLMMGDTAYIEFLYTPSGAKDSVVLWSYTAPWYLTDSEEVLLNLLEGQQ